MVTFSPLGAPTDTNDKFGLFAVSNADGVSLVRLAADPATGALLVSDTSSGGVIVKETPAGLIDGINTTYTLSAAPASTSAILNFSINGQELYAPSDYTLSGQTLTFGTPLDISLAGLPFQIVYVTGTIQIFTYGGTSTVTSASSPVTVATNVYLYRANTTSGSITFNLPAAASSTGVQLVFKKISAANSLIIDGNGSETIDGALTKTLSANLASTMIYCNGTSWDVIV